MKLQNCARICIPCKLCTIRDSSPQDLCTITFSKPTRNNLAFIVLITIPKLFKTKTSTRNTLSMHFVVVQVYWIEDWIWLSLSHSCSLQHSWKVRKDKTQSRLLRVIASRKLILEYYGQKMMILPLPIKVCKILPNINFTSFEIKIYWYSILHDLLH